MKYKHTIVALSLLSVTTIGHAESFLSADEIKSVFSGKTVIWEHMFKSKSGKSYFSEDGLLTGVSNGEKREGKWQVDNQKLCVSWGKCLAIEPDGNGGYYKVKGGSKRIIHIKALESGNTL